MRNLLTLIVFIPLAIIGAIWVGYKQLVVSKRLVAFFLLWMR